MSTRDLDNTAVNRLFTATIARLRMTSETPAAFAPMIRKNAQHDGSHPHGARCTVADRLADGYKAVTTDDARRSLLIAAMAELKAMTHSPPPPAEYAERGSLPWRRRIATDDRSLRAVADEHGVSHEQVRKLRQQFRKAA